MTRYMKSAACVGLSLACIALTSCSQVERLDVTAATLEGKVTYRGKPVPHALVIVASQSASGTTNADEQGNYKLNHAPIGAVKIAVNTAAARGAMMGKMMAAKQKSPTGEKSSVTVETPQFVDVPEKYFDPNTSGVTTNVPDNATTTYDIVLE